MTGYLIAKGLPSYLRNMPGDQLVTSPYIKGRLIAHDRGRAAGTLTARGKQFEQRWSSKYPVPTKRRIVLAPPLAVRDAALRYEGVRTVRATQAAAQRVQNQGRRAREASRTQIGKNYIISKAIRGWF